MRPKAEPPKQHLQTAALDVSTRGQKFLRQGEGIFLPVPSKEENKLQPSCHWISKTELLPGEGVQSLRGQRQQKKLPHRDRRGSKWSESMTTRQVRDLKEKAASRRKRASFSHHAWTTWHKYQKMPRKAMGLQVFA